MPLPRYYCHFKKKYVLAALFFLFFPNVNSEAFYFLTCITLYHNTTMQRLEEK